MKKDAKDPIKDKYTRKIGFFKKIHLKILKFKNYLNNDKNAKKEIELFSSMIFDIVIYGILGGLSALLLGVDMLFINFVSIGAFLWLFENKFLGFITSILSSIKLVNINN